MGLILDNPSELSVAQRQLLILGADEVRTDRVNVFGYGPPGSGKSYFASTFPRPFLIDTDQNALTVKSRVASGEVENFPILQTTDWKTVLEILSDPVHRLPSLFHGTRWEGYQPQTLIVDTLSTLEGYIFDEILDQAAKSAKVSQNTWNELKRKILAITRAAWNLPLNTVLLAHDQGGRQQTADMQKKDPGPLLTGSLIKQVPAQCDIYLYFEARTGVGTVEYVAHTRPTLDGMPARVNGIELPSVNGVLVNPTYTKIRESLDKLESQTRQRMEKENA
ncbi:MAG: AAA family ATPase [Gammaproteobacteria bacterium]